MPSTVALAYDAAAVPADIASLLRTLAERYPISPKTKRGATRLAFAPGAAVGTVSVTLTAGSATIAYDTVAHAARGIGALLAGLVKPGKEYRETTTFTTLGMMLDCSRNAVMNAPHLKTWLQQLALLGYNLAMLYTEDTFEVPGEPYFGYLRGRYTGEELREIDEYAAALGIEMVGCIQTLGHLNRVLHWAPFAKCRDTFTVVMEGEPETYALIDKMVATIAKAHRSKRIHIGMDEAHELGRGRFMDLKGHERAFDIFNRHLDRVLGICRTHGVSPMIWSDMYFRMGSKNQDYYDDAWAMPDDVRRAIPQGVGMVYWDYYKDDVEKYRAMIKRHRTLGSEPIMASAVWTHSRVWYDQHTTERMVAPCVRACREEKLGELIFTMWGDDGHYCEMDSSLAGLAFGAEHAYTGEADPARLAKRYAAVCGVDYRLVTEAAKMTFPATDVDAQAILSDDPLLGVYWRQRDLGDPKAWKDAAKRYAAISAKLKPHARITAPVDIGHGYNLAACLAEKIAFGLELRAAYASGKPAALRAVKRRIPRMTKAIDALLDSWRRQWHRRNKTFGLEIVQIRLAGLRERYLEIGRRLDELVDGTAETIAELEERTDKPMDWLTTHYANMVSPAYTGM
ncbi:MAG: family 20 glycosylhydrolase [Planctomycetes bacterium]|nr:family 20 glycosylhydrolase [Planctomycetota bacterium]